MPKKRSKIEYFLLVLIAAAVASLGFILWFVNKNARSQFEIAATQKIQGYVGTIRKVRNIYTEEIVGKVKKNRMNVSHSYINKDDTIPLPATLTILLAEEIAKDSSVNIRLYSPFPFPWREASGGLKSNFSQRAWEALQKNPSEPYFEVEPVSEVNDRERLRYATADVMTQACVDCHNAHPQTPKADWKAGDVRGILEVDAYFEDDDFKTVIKDLRDLQAMSWAAIIVGLSLIGLLFGVMRRSSLH